MVLFKCFAYIYESIRLDSFNNLEWSNYEYINRMFWGV